MTESTELSDAEKMRAEVAVIEEVLRIAADPYAGPLPIEMRVKRLEHWVSALMLSRRDDLNRQADQLDAKGEK